MVSNSVNGITEGLIKLVLTAVESKFINEVRTQIPGYITEFDEEKQLATVQIGVQQLTIAGKTLDPPPIIECPVCIYGATGGALEVEIASGDECLVMFSMRCIDGWREQGGIAPLSKLERFRKTDAFAVLAPRSLGNVLKSYDNDGIKLRSKEGTEKVWIKKDKSIVVQNENGIATLKTNGDVNANGAIINTSGNVITAGSANVNNMRDKINELITAFNAHAHTGNQGSPTPLIGAPVTTL